MRERWRKEEEEYEKMMKERKKIRPQMGLALFGRPKYIEERECSKFCVVQKFVSC